MNSFINLPNSEVFVGEFKLQMNFNQFCSSGSNFIRASQNDFWAITCWLTFDHELSTGTMILWSMLFSLIVFGYNNVCDKEIETRKN